MDTKTLSSLAQLLIQGMVSARFIWAWSQERKERQERETWMKELISLVREAYGLRPSGANVTANGSRDTIKE